MSKNKPQRHKESNVFKFKTFAEHIDQIDIRKSAFYHIQHANQAVPSDDSNGTHFRECYVEWSDKNLSNEYKGFQRRIRDIVTLPQLMHHQHDVVQWLDEALAAATTLSLEPLLALVVALARDLHDEFYPHFMRFLSRLIALLRTQDADQLRWTFVCLASLFKHQKRPIKRNIGDCFGAIMPLLDDRRQPEHIANFAAEAFAFVARDIRDRDGFIRLVLAALRQHQQRIAAAGATAAATTPTTAVAGVVGVRGCGRMLYETMRGVGGQLHSCTGEVLPALLRALGHVSSAAAAVDDDDDAELLHAVLGETVLQLLYNTQPAHMAPFWDHLHRALHNALDAIEANDADDNNDEDRRSLTVQRLLTLAGQAVEFRHGKMVCGHGGAASEVTRLIETLQRSVAVLDDEAALRCATELVAAVLLSAQLAVTQEQASSVCKAVLGTVPAPVFEAFVWNVRVYAQFELLVWPHASKYFEGRLADGDVQQLLCRLLAERAELRLRPRQAATLRLLEERIARATTTDDNDAAAALESLLMALLVWSRVPGAAHVDRVQPNVCALLARTCDQLAATTNTTTTTDDGDDDANDDDDDDDTNGPLECARKRLLFVLAALVRTALNVERPQWLPTQRLIEVLLPLCRPSRAHPLRAAALAELDRIVGSMTAAAESKPTTTETQFERVHAAIAGNLAAEFGNVRLLTARVLQRLGRQRSADAAESMYDVMVAIESQVAGVTTFREQLNAAERLAADGRLFEAAVADCDGLHGRRQKLDGLRYLLGALFINFRPLWKRLVELIGTYAQRLPAPEFWAVFGGQLDAVTRRLRRAAGAHDACPVPSAGLSDSTNNWLLDDYCAMWEPAAAADTRPDYVNYRQQLWRGLAGFGTLSEVRNRDVVQQLLDFVQHEYRRSHENDTLTWNLLLPNGGGADATQMTIDADADANAANDATAMDIDDDDNAGDKDDADADDATDDGGRTASIAGTQSTLMAMLGVFARLANPSQIHRHAEVYALLLELLGHRNPAMQRLALDCILAHRHRYLEPYRQHLCDIVADDKFKSALDAIHLDGGGVDGATATAAVQPEHRARLMDIVLRILHSKLTAKVAGKGGGQARKQICLRFLGRCAPAEVLQLLRTTFATYEQWLEPAARAADVRPLLGAVRAQLRLDAVPSPKKLQSTLNLVAIVRRECVGRMGDELLRYLVHVMFAVAAVAEAVLAATAAPTAAGAVHVKHVQLFKRLRADGQRALADFCTRIDAFAWRADEVDAMFELYVWPQLARLPSEGIHASTPLLKLFEVFAGNARYIRLLIKQRPSVADACDGDDATTDASDTTPMRYITDLLLEPKTRPHVCLDIMKMIESLLESPPPPRAIDADNDAPPPALPIPAGRCLEPRRPAHLADIPLGSAILLPHLDRILLQIQQHVTKRRGLSSRDLHIVSKCTRLVHDAASAERLLNVLLPILIRKSSRRSAGTGTEPSADAELELQQAIETIQNMFERIEAPARHLRTVAPLFAHIGNVVGPRKQLCALLQTIARRTPAGSGDDAAGRLQRTADVVRSLNAWHRRFVQEPDYDERLAAFGRLDAWLAAGDVDVDLCLLVVYHCFHCVRHDATLRLRATETLHSMLPAIVQQLQQLQQQQQPQPPTTNHPVRCAAAEQLIDVVLDLVRTTLAADAGKDVREMGIQLLGVLAARCPLAHPVLGDLHAFTNGSGVGGGDTDGGDFFANLTDIQVHTRRRALVRFRQVADRLRRRPLPRTLLQFVLPLATPYVTHDEHNVRTAAIEAVGVVAALLPWHQYHKLLAFYLYRMRHSSGNEHQAAWVRLVRQILDAFHFDLRRAAEPAEATGGEPIAHEAADNDNGEEQPQQLEEQEAAAATPATSVEQLDFELQQAGEHDDDDDDADDDADDNANADEATALAPLVLEQPLVPSARAARRIVRTITTSLIAQLSAAITTASTYEHVHSVNRANSEHRRRREHDEMLRVPLAFALVRLLQRLPAAEAQLQRSLPGLLSKVCQFLKSPLPSVRSEAREQLCAIMQAVGTAHLDTLLAHMRACLTRGFQVHVLSATVCKVLHALAQQLRTDDRRGADGDDKDDGDDDNDDDDDGSGAPRNAIDRNLPALLHVLLEDVFGERVQEERDQRKIGEATPEARASDRAFTALEVVAHNCSERCLIDLMVPLRERLTAAPSARTIDRVLKCCQRIADGLQQNRRLGTRARLEFVAGIVLERIAELRPAAAAAVSPKATAALATDNDDARVARLQLAAARARPDTFAIQPEPRGRRSGVAHASTAARRNPLANAHVLVEFGLRMLLGILKRDQLKKLRCDYEPLLAPLVPSLTAALGSVHIETVALAMECLSAVWAHGLRVRRLDEAVETEVAPLVFAVLHKYGTAGIGTSSASGSGSGSSGNVRLVRCAFRTVVALLRHCTAFRCGEEQLGALLAYCECDLSAAAASATGDCATAFELLRVIVDRRLLAPSMHAVMTIVGRLLVTAEQPETRTAAQKCMQQYLVHYPLGAKVNGFVRHFVDQLRYETVGGRQSAIGMLSRCCREFPLAVLNKHAALLFVELGGRLVNDESADCRRLAARCVETLLGRLTAEQRQPLFELVMQLLADAKSSHREMAAQLCTRFVVAEGKAFEKRCSRVLPRLIGMLPSGGADVGRYVRLAPGMACSSNDDGDDDGDDRTEEGLQQIAQLAQRATDHQLIQVLNTLLLILEKFAPELERDHSQYVDALAEAAQQLLAYEHVWVRSSAAKVLGMILARLDAARVRRLLQNDDDDDDAESMDQSDSDIQFVYADARRQLKSLCLDLCAQLQPDATDIEMAKQVTQNLLYVAQMIRQVPLEKQPATTTTDDDDGGSGATKAINLVWLVHRLCRPVRAEVALAPHSTVLRTAIFRLFKDIAEDVAKPEHLPAGSLVRLLKLAPLLTPLVRELNEEDKNIDAQLRQLAGEVTEKLRDLVGRDVYDQLRIDTDLRLRMRRAQRVKEMNQMKVLDPQRAALRKEGEKARKRVAHKRKMDVLKGREMPKRKKPKKRPAAEDLF